MNRNSTARPPYLSLSFGSWCKVEHIILQAPITLTIQTPTYNNHLSHRKDEEHSSYSAHHKLNNL